MSSRPAGADPGFPRSGSRPPKSPASHRHAIQHTQGPSQEKRTEQGRRPAARSGAASRQGSHARPQATGDPSATRPDRRHHAHPTARRRRQGASPGAAPGSETLRCRSERSRPRRRSPRPRPRHGPAPASCGGEEKMERGRLRRQEGNHPPWRPLGAARGRGEGKDAHP